MNQINQISDISTERATSVASYSASITTAAGGAFTVNDLALWGGLLLAALTFVVNLFYQGRKERREAALSALESERAKVEKDLALEKLARARRALDYIDDES